MIKLLKSLTKNTVLKNFGRIVVISLFLISFFISRSSVTAQAEGQIFYDDFATLANWVESNELDWNIESPEEKQVTGHDSSNLVVHADDCDTFCVITLSAPLDLSSLSGASINFWRYIDNELDSGEYLKVEIFDGISWNQIYYWTYGSGNDNTWHYEQLMLPSQYLINNFKIRFITKENSTSESVEIDDILIYEGTSFPTPPPGVDIYTGNTTTSGLLSPGQAISSEIETSGDVDWFRINLTQGQVVQFDMEAKDTNKGTLLDPYLKGVYNSQGNLISGTADDDSGAGLNSRVIFTTPTSGNYFVSAGAWGSDIGTYTLTAAEVGSAPPSPTPTPTPSPTPTPTPTATPTPTPSPSPTPLPSPSPTPSPTPTPTPTPGSGKTQAFSDDFESAGGVWTESNELDWNRELPDERQVPGKSSGNLVAHADDCDNFCVISLTTPLNLSTFSEGTLKFWRYVDNDLDSGEYLKVEIFDGSSWNQIYYWTNGNGDDDTWHYQEYALPGNYLVNNFNIRFTTKESNSYEDVEIDDVLIEGVGKPINNRSNVNIDGYCSYLNYSHPVLIGPSARDWVCEDNSGYQVRIDMTQVCLWQNSSSHPFASLQDPSNPYSWSCNTLPQAPWPSGPETTLIQPATQTPLVAPPACPIGTGPDGITAGDYPPQRLTQEQRQWLWNIFGKGAGETAPVGYGGERCAESNDDSNQNFFDMVCRRGHIGPGGITPGDYPPESLAQEQRQFLFEEFGNQGTAPVGYGGERCLGQDQRSVWDIHVAEVCSSGAVGPYQIKPQAYPPQDLTQEERQWLWDIFEKGDGQPPVGYGGERCPNQTENAPAPDRTGSPYPSVLGSQSCTSPSNLQVGNIAVSGVSGLNVRENPRLTSNTAFTLSYSELITIVSGPSCSDSLTWWQIGTSSGNGGFVPEINKDGKRLLILNGEPLPGYQPYTFPQPAQTTDPNNPPPPENSYFIPENSDELYVANNILQSIALEAEQGGQLTTEGERALGNIYNETLDILNVAAASYSCASVATPYVVILLAPFQPELLVPFIPAAVSGIAQEQLALDSTQNCAEGISDFIDKVVADLNAYYQQSANITVFEQGALNCGINPADAISYVNSRTYPDYQALGLICLYGDEVVNQLTPIPSY